VRELAVIIVSSPGVPEWLPPCLRSLEKHAGGVDAEVVVVENEPERLVAPLLASEFPQVRVVSCANRGFGHANNRGAELVDARYLLFLNPDTEIVSGTLRELLDAADARPRAGVIGVRQVLPDGTTYPTARAFPSVTRLAGEALGAERFGRVGRRLRESELDLSRYETEFAPDWTIGSFLLVPREAWEAAGPFDERFFLYSEETDLCRGITDAGWEVRHVPVMTIVHHVHSGQELAPRMQAQLAYAKAQYGDKHLRGPRRVAFHAALRLRYMLRAVVGPEHSRAAARHVLAVLAGREPPPFLQPAGG
jgi:GT2 family glycosyltransferase